jgi:hypothetical protein
MFKLMEYFYQFKTSTAWVVLPLQRLRANSKSREELPNTLKTLLMMLVEYCIISCCMYYDMSLKYMTQ